MRRGREMIDLLAVEEPKPKSAKIRAASYEAAIDQLFKRMRSSSSALTLQLPFCFEVGSLSDRLMSSTPE